MRSESVSKKQVTIREDKNTLLIEVHQRHYYTLAWKDYIHKCLLSEVIFPPKWHLSYKKYVSGIHLPKKIIYHVFVCDSENYMEKLLGIIFLGIFVSVTWNKVFGINFAKKSGWSVFGGRDLVGCLEKGWNRQGVRLQYLAAATTLKTCLEHPFTQPIADKLLHLKKQKCNAIALRPLRAIASHELLLELLQRQTTIAATPLAESTPSPNIQNLVGAWIGGSIWNGFLMGMCWTGLPERSADQIGKKVDNVKTWSLQGLGTMFLWVVQWPKHQRFPEWSWRSFRRNWWRTSGEVWKEIFELFLLGKIVRSF